MLATVLAVAKTALVATAVIHGATYTVAPGNTMSEIAVSHGDTLVAVEQANPQITDPNWLYVGETVAIPVTGTANSASPDTVPAAPVAVPTASSGCLADVPGVPSAFAACVAYRESTDLQNPAADGNAYGIIPASGYTVAGMTIAQQKQVFAEIYASAGPRAWDADGCPTHLGLDHDASADESSNNGPWGP